MTRSSISLPNLNLHSLNPAQQTSRDKKPDEIVTHEGVFRSDGILRGIDLFHHVAQFDEGKVDIYLSGDYLFQSFILTAIDARP